MNYEFTRLLIRGGWRSLRRLFSLSSPPPHPSHFPFQLLSPLLLLPLDGGGGQVPPCIPASTPLAVKTCSWTSWWSVVHRELQTRLGHEPSGQNRRLISLFFLFSDKQYFFILAWLCYKNMILRTMNCKLYFLSVSPMVLPDGNVTWNVIELNISEGNLHIACIHQCSNQIREWNKHYMRKCKPSN